MPGVDQFSRQYDDQHADGRVGVERGDTVLQNGAAAKVHKLLRHWAACSQPAPAGNHDHAYRHNP